MSHENSNEKQDAHEHHEKDEQHEHKHHENHKTEHADTEHSHTKDHKPEHTEHKQHEHHKPEHTEHKHHEHKETASSPPQRIIEESDKSYSKHFIIAALIVLLSFAAFSHFQNEPIASNVSAGSTSGNTGEKVTLDFYVMSQCPYGLDVENAIKPVLDELGDSVDFTLNFIAGLSGDEFTSLHGAPEVAGDIVQLCAAKYEPKKYMEMIICQNKDPRAIPGNWEGCAKDAGMEVESIRSCYEGEEGKELLSESIKKTESVGATGSPTMYLNGKPYSNIVRTPLSFKRDLCENLEGNPACERIPVCEADYECDEQEKKIGKCINPNQEDARCEYLDPVKLDLIVLKDKNCVSCDTSRMLELTRQIFLGVIVEEMDVSSPEGKALIKELDIKVVPAYIFGKELEETNSWKEKIVNQMAFEKKGERYKLRDSVTGASYFVDEKAKQEYYKSIGVELGDNRPQIDFFVMSFCPYGDSAEEAIEPVYQLLKDKADFNPKYVLSGQAGAYSSLHGPQELNQGIRELCVDKYMGTGKWFEFALAINKECSYKDADSCWEGVADKLGLDVEKIESCEQDEGKELAGEQVRLRELLRKVRGSPTVFIDGQLFESPDPRRAPTANEYKNALCAAFETAPPECEKTVAEPAQVASSAGGCS